VWAGKAGEGESVLRMMMRRTTGRPGLLAKARPTKASSIEARQYSGADTRVGYTRLAEHKEGGREFKNRLTSFLLLAIIAA
jgi:hypothetical protein